MTCSCPSCLITLLVSVPALWVTCASSVISVILIPLGFIDDLLFRSPSSAHGFGLEHGITGKTSDCCLHQRLWNIPRPWNRDGIRGDLHHVLPAGEEGGGVRSRRACVRL